MSIPHTSLFFPSLEDWPWIRIERVYVSCLTLVLIATSFSGCFQPAKRGQKGSAYQEPTHLPRSLHRLSPLAWRHQKCLERLRLRAKEGYQGTSKKSTWSKQCAFLWVFLMFCYSHVRTFLFQREPFEELLIQQILPQRLLMKYLDAEGRWMMGSSWSIHIGPLSCVFLLYNLPKCVVDIKQICSKVWAKILRLPILIRSRPGFKPLRASASILFYGLVYFEGSSWVW